MNLGINLCVRCETRWIENKDTRLCASCSHDDRKSERTQAKIVKPVKKVSEKRAGQNLEYAKLRKQYLEVYPVCEAHECNNKSTQIHHVNGREGEKLTSTAYFMAVCSHCHDKIHSNPQWSIENGYMILRSTNN